MISHNYFNGKICLYLTSFNTMVSRSIALVPVALFHSFLICWPIWSHEQRWAGMKLAGSEGSLQDTEQGAEGGRTKLGRDQRALELFLWKTRRTKHIRDEVALPPVGLETLIWTVKNLLPISWQQPEPIFLYQFWGILRSVLGKLAKPVYLAKPIYMMRSSCEYWFWYVCHYKHHLCG